MNNFDYLMEVLEDSVKKHGEKPLTNVWLLNIMRTARRRAERDEHRSELEGACGDIF